MIQRRKKGDGSIFIFFLLWPPLSINRTVPFSAFKVVWGANVHSRITISSMSSVSVDR